MLEGIDFGLPVLETLCQMHERIDGGGYPEGLGGDQILTTAQVLGLCDVFCARVEPRAHRSGISSDQALRILDDNAQRYDPRLVAALRAVIESGEFEQPTTVLSDS